MRRPTVLEIVGEADLERAWAIGETFDDQAFSLVDRTSFALMERLGLTRAASFDDNFAVCRLPLRPGARPGVHSGALTPRAGGGGHRGSVPAWTE